MKYLPEFFKSESAVSFGLIAIAAFLIGGTAIWINFYPVFNQMFSTYNINIEAGLVTRQNQEAMEFHQNMVGIVAVIVLLLGVVSWGYVRALEKRNEP